MLFDKQPAGTKFTRRHKIVAAGVAGFLLLFVGIPLLFVHLNNTRSPNPKPSPTKEEASAQHADASAPQANNLEDQLKLATVRRGEGVEHALIRQLLANPQAYGFQGDIAKKRVVKKWAGRRAHLMAVRAGYFDWKFGAEIRVKHPNKAAFLLEKDADGKMRVAEYAALPHDGFGPSPEPQKTLTLASRTTHSAFLGWPGAHASIPAYEYLYTG